MRGDGWGVALGRLLGRRKGSEGVNSWSRRHLDSLITARLPAFCGWRVVC